MRIRAAPSCTDNRRSAEVRAEDVEYSLEGVRVSRGRDAFRQSLTGRHSVSNILAGIAVAGVYGIAPDALTGTSPESSARKNARRALPSPRHSGL